MITTSFGSSFARIHTEMYETDVAVHIYARETLSLSLLRLSYKSQQFLELGLSDERRASRQSPVAPRGPITRRPWYTTTKERRKPLRHPLPPSRGDFPVSAKLHCCHLRKWSTSATTEKKSGNLHPLEISQKTLSLKDYKRSAWWISVTYNLYNLL